MRCRICKNYVKTEEIVRAARKLGKVEAEPTANLWGKIKASLEVWKTIEGFEAYEVSNMGHVRRCLPGVRNTAKVGHILKPNKLKKGYLVVRLYNKGEHRHWLVHVLVAKAFVPNPKNLPQVNHLGANDDNRATQLEWRSEAGNMLHAVKTGRKAGNGVSFNKKAQKWRAGYCSAPNVRVYLGEFDTYEEAMAVRERAVASIPHIE